MNTLKYLLFASVLAFAGCADDGDPGPKGDKGDIGEQGAPGEQGETGTANVMYSEWISPNWREFPNQFIWEHSDDNITQKIVDEGFVLMYYKVASGNHAQPLYGLNSASLTMNLIIYPGSSSAINIYLLATSIVGNSVTVLNNLRANYVFRYIIVPGGIPTEGRVAPVDYDDYEVLKSYYNIPD